MKFIKNMFLVCLCLPSFSYAQDFFRLNELSEPVEINYTYLGHGGMSSVATIAFDLSSPSDITRVTITNQTVDSAITKLTDADKTEGNLNPDALSSIVIDAKHNKDKFFYITYFLAKGSEGGAKDKTLMVTSGENELLIEIEYSDGHSANGIEKLNVIAQMHY